MLKFNQGHATDGESRRTRAKMFFKRKNKQEIKNARLRERYANNEGGFRDKCEARRIAYKLKKLKEGLCYLCQTREGKDLHHPDYKKPELVFPLCRYCHNRLHHLIKLHTSE